MYQINSLTFQQGVINPIQKWGWVFVLVELKEQIWLQKEKGMDNSRGRSQLMATESDQGGKKHGDWKRGSFERFRIHLRKEQRGSAREPLELASPDHFFSLWVTLTFQSSVLKPLVWIWAPSWGRMGCERGKVTRKCNNSHEELPDSEGFKLRDLEGVWKDLKDQVEVKITKN